jgi:predicted transposase/invertase (TIGR01784 family)
MTTLDYKLTNDTLFKMLFTKFPSLLKMLVAALLKIQPESIKKFTITNSNLSPEFVGDKYCKLDFNMEVDGQKINLEVQVEKENHYPDRAVYYLAKEFSASLKRKSKV